MFTSDARTGSAVAGAGRPTDERAERHRDPVFTSRFERWYGPLVGLARHVLDPGAATERSLERAEDIVVDVFGAHRHRGGSDESAEVAQLVAEVADGCLAAMVGHPGSVPLHYEILGPDVDFDGQLPLAELHGSLNGMRRIDRRIGVLALAAGFSPAQVATLLQRPLDDVIDRLARVCTRLADGRRIGLSDDVPPALT